MRAVDPVKRFLASSLNRFRAFRAARERSVKNIARKNSMAAFDEIYGTDDLIAEYLGPERLRFYEEVADVCASFRPSRVIDVGCGPGYLLAALIRRCPDLDEVVGVDFSEAAIHRLLEIAPGARGEVRSVYELDLGDERFDLVLATEVLEHLERPRDALARMQTLCSDDGRLLVTVPDGAHDDWEGHVNFWDANAFRELLSTVGPASVQRTSGGDLLGVVQP